MLRSLTLGAMLQSLPLPTLMRKTCCSRNSSKLLNAWSKSKVNDFKPLFGLLFADALRSCAFWGVFQEDMLLGDVRHYLDDQLLSNIDIVSPLPAPFYHNGPFMVYRNIPAVNELWRRSKHWEWVIKSSEYVVFDECTRSDSIRL